MHDLDAVIAAPKQHRVVLENDLVRVLDTRIEPGETTPMHTHDWPAACYVLSWDHVVRRDATGETTFDSRAMGLKLEPGQSTWLGVLEPHTLENVGTNPVHLICVEIKSGT